MRSLAQRHAAAWLARAHPDEYQQCYAQALNRVRGQVPGLAAWRARDRAARQASADLQALFRDEYAARFQAELAALQPDEPAAVEAGRVERPAAARARLRALLWLAGQHPDQARERFAVEAARLPLRVADRAPRRRRALAWVRALEGLRAGVPGAVPGPLRRRAGPPRRPGAHAVTSFVVPGCGLGRRLPAAASAARPGHPAQASGEGVVARLS